MFQFELNQEFSVLFVKSNQEFVNSNEMLRHRRENFSNCFVFKQQKKQQVLTVSLPYFTISLEWQILDSSQNKTLNSF